MSNQVSVQKKENETIKDYIDNVQVQFEEMNKDSNITLPQNYSIGNAVKSAYLKLLETKDKDKKPVLDVCSKHSVANALLEMVIQGLSPAKNQCYFIAYGKSLQLMRSYMGTISVVKRLKGIKDVKAYCIYEGDEFETEFDIDTATIKITKFNPNFANIDTAKIKGAFAVIIGEDGPVHTEIMTITQIKASWDMGSNGTSKAHKNFPEEMAKKTVINRACKMYVNTSDDSDILIDAFNRTTEAEYKDEIKEEIEQNANTEELDFKEDNPKKDVDKVVDVEYTEVKNNGQVQMNMNQPINDDEVPF